MRFLRPIILLAALTTACASQQPVPAHGGTKFASVGNTRTCRGPLNDVTGNNATVVIFDTSTDSGAKYLTNSGAERLLVSMFFDQAVTVNYQARIRGSSTWRTVNGDGSGDSVSASTFTAIDFRIMAADTRITVVTGGTGPTTSEIDICPTYETPASL